MGTYTANYNLYMPTIGEQGWGELINGNYQTIDTTMKSLSNRATALENADVAFDSRITALEAGEFESITVADEINGNLCVNLTTDDTHTLGTYTVVPDVTTQSTSYLGGGTYYTDNIVINDISRNLKKGITGETPLLKINVSASTYTNNSSDHVYGYTVYIYHNDEIKSQNKATTTASSISTSCAVYVAKGDTIKARVTTSSSVLNYTRYLNVKVSGLDGNFYLG